MNEYPILLVGEEPETRDTLMDLLVGTGYSVETARSGSEALKKSQKTRFRLVITDVDLPRMSGLELLKNLKKAQPTLPVVLLTSDRSVDRAVEAMREGASDYILKPLCREIVELAIKKIAKNGNGTGGNPVHKGHGWRNDTDREIITQDPKLLKILGLAANVAHSNATVLIQGESGTGKEMLARLIHHHSARHDGPYVAVNCASLPDGLAESELFGHEKGAFTGAVNRKIGKFELANHGTIVLDEISEMPPPVQAKLLRALQERIIDRVGGTKPVSVDARVIAISNVDLKKAVKTGKFREDLYYRLNVIPLTIPPLRARKGDIPLLTEHFLKKYGSANGAGPKRISREAMTTLLSLEWKGNVRELENTVQRAILLSDGELIEPDHLLLGEVGSPPDSSLRIRPGVSVKEMERELIFMTLKEVNENRTHAAEMLGISIRTLRNKLKEYKEEANLNC